MERPAYGGSRLLTVPKHRSLIPVLGATTCWTDPQEAMIRDGGGSSDLSILDLGDNSAPVGVPFHECHGPQALR